MLVFYERLALGGRGEDNTTLELETLLEEFLLFSRLWNFSE